MVDRLIRAEFVSELIAIMLLEVMENHMEVMENEWIFHSHTQMASF